MIVTPADQGLVSYKSFPTATGHAGRAGTVVTVKLSSAVDKQAGAFNHLDGACRLPLTGAKVGRGQSVDIHGLLCKAKHG